MPRQLSLAIVGADHPNKGKAPTRWFEIRTSKPGEPVELRREPRNEHDPHAIAVYSCRGVQIGYVRAERAAYIGLEMHRGIVTAIFQRIERWGATIRVGLDGAEPTLPDDSDHRSHDWPPPAPDDADWWPDAEPEWQPDE